MPPPRPHPLARSRFSRWAEKGIEALWRAGITEKPPLEPDYLWQVGAKGFGPADEVSIRSAEDVAGFRERLSMLSRSLREEARLNALGQTMAYGQLTTAIRNRHKLGRFWRKRPELAETPLAPPLVVVGQMRAGTTRIHRLLAADPRHAGTRFCDSHYPVPSRPDWRPLKARLALAMARLINPWLDTLHPFGATRVDEEIGWLAAGLSACTYEAQYRVPTFSDFDAAHDSHALYREFARILRTDAAVRGNADHPRIMKCPQFSEDLPALLTQFPNARIVVAHRPRTEVLASTVSLVASQAAFQSDHASLEAIEAEWKRKLDLRESRIEKALAAFEGPLAHVDFERLGQDWRAEIARIYAALGIELSPAAVVAMAAEQARAARSPHRAHHAALRGFAQA